MLQESKERGKRRQSRSWNHGRGGNLANTSQFRSVTCLCVSSYVPTCFILCAYVCVILRAYVCHPMCLHVSSYVPTYVSSCLPMCVILCAYVCVILCVSSSVPTCVSSYVCHPMCLRVSSYVPTCVIRTCLRVSSYVCHHMCLHVSSYVPTCHVLLLLCAAPICDRNCASCVQSLALLLCNAAVYCCCA